MNGASSRWVRGGLPSEAAGGADGALEEAGRWTVWGRVPCAWKGVIYIWHLFGPRSGNCLCNFFCHAAVRKLSCLRSRRWKVNGSCGKGQVVIPKGGCAEYSEGQEHGASRGLLPVSPASAVSSSGLSARGQAGPAVAFITPVAKGEYSWTHSPVPRG